MYTRNFVTNKFCTKHPGDKAGLMPHIEYAGNSPRDIQSQQNASYINNPEPAANLSVCELNDRERR